MGDFYRRYVQLATRASERMPEAYIVGLTDAFFLMDMDYDGVVTASDLHAVLNRPDDAEHSVDFGDFLRMHGFDEGGKPWASAEYVGGLHEGFMVFTDSWARPGAISTTGAYGEDFLRRLDRAHYDEDHVDGQMSYTEFMRFVIANHGDV